MSYTINQAAERDYASGRLLMKWTAKFRNQKIGVNAKVYIVVGFFFLHESRDPYAVFITTDMDLAQTIAHLETEHRGWKYVCLVAEDTFGNLPKAAQKCVNKPKPCEELKIRATATVEFI